VTRFLPVDAREFDVEAANGLVGDLHRLVLRARRSLGRAGDGANSFDYDAQIDAALAQLVTLYALDARPMEGQP
jgi:hypothetical protein